MGPRIPAVAALIPAAGARLRLLLLSSALLLPSVGLVAQQPDTLGQGALLAVNAARFRAMVREDLPGLDTLLAPELTYIHSDGGLESKTQFLATLRTGGLRYQAIDPSELAARLYGEVGSGDRPFPDGGEGGAGAAQVQHSLHYSVSADRQAVAVGGLASDAHPGNLNGQTCLRSRRTATNVDLSRENKSLAAHSNSSGSSNTPMSVTTYQVSESMSLSVREYLSRAKDQTVPPLVLELILRSGKSFYIKNVFAFDKQAEMVALRVWDVRALSQADLDTVLRRLSAVQSRDELENIEKLHPKLDEGNLWVLVSEIEALVEWHSDLWPGVDRPEARQVVVGFRP